MFRVDWMERYLSRVGPRQVLIVWLPVVLYFLYRGARDPDLGGASLASAALCGLFAWTFLEYVLHRWVFHFEPRPGSELQADLSFLIHGVHHDYPSDPDRLVMPPVVAMVIAVAVGFPMYGLLGAHLFAPVFAGLLTGYLWYDLTHYAVHHLRPHTALGKAQKKNHLLHHFKSPRARYGVTTPLWDVVFGTLPRVDPSDEAAASAH
jgi:sterol desaturase/sphingolipid hydroxylase (fatty acid hydroxylase superfamily)